MPLHELTRIATTLRNCGRAQSINKGKSLHSHLSKLGLLDNIFIANNLISMYVDFNSLDYAHKLFDDMPEKNIVTWTTMVSAYSSCGRPVEAIRLYNFMVEGQLEVPNGFMYSAVLKACGLVGEDFGLGRSIHERVLREGVGGDVVLMNAILDMYVKCGEFSEGRKVFDGMVRKNAVTWNILVSGYCKEGLVEEGVELFYQMPERNVVSWNSVIAGFTEKRSLRALEFVGLMHREGVRFDGFSFPCALKSCGFFGMLDIGMAIHCYIVKSGFEYSCFTASALVDMYSDCGDVDDAIKFFGQYSSCSSAVYHNLAIWNSMLSGYVINGLNGAAIDLISQIHFAGVRIDTYTLSSVLKLCINLSNLRLGLQVHGFTVTSGYQADYVVGSILVDLYARLGDIDGAIKLFHRLQDKDVVAWSGLITGCCQMGLNSLALSLFREMVYLNLGVDQFIISSVLKVCSSLASLGSGRQAHAFSVKRGYDTEGVIVTALTDFYSKCGEIEDGLNLFNSMAQRDTVCWTGIIVGCGQNGRVKEAIRYFHEMVRSGLRPNEVTFLGVLSACRHAGFVEEAWSIFNSMRTEHGLEPHLEHYYCMIDLLGQAGCFKEAENIIADMPIKPDRTIWGSLLAACGTHKNTEMIRHIAEQLVRASPNDPSTYVMISNAFATLGMWDDLCEIRGALKDIGTREAGKSWIELSA